MNKQILKYIKILRLDHWIKQLFLIPGCICSFFFNENGVRSIDMFIITRGGGVFRGFISASLIASANYVINEYLDAKFDQYHPVKKFRSLVSGDVNPKIIFLMWLTLTILGLLLAIKINTPFFCMMLWLWVMGIVYNLNPIRTKDIPILDVLSESINNAIRLLAGWFMVSSLTIPPVSLIAGYWMGGAFLMAIKRYAEYRMIGDPETAGKYRKSFKFYSEKFLLVSAFFYAMCSVFLMGIFMIKYRIELVLFVPGMIGLFCYYFTLSFEQDSSVQKPEKLYHERGLMCYLAFLIFLFALLMVVDIPEMKLLTDSSLIKLW